MADWLDFVKKIRKDEDEEKRNPARGFLNKGASFIDDALDVVERTAGGVKKNVDSYFAPTQNMRARDFVRELPGAAVKTARDTLELGEDALQGVARGVVNIGMSVKEAGEDNGDAVVRKSINDLKAMPEAERQKFLDEDEARGGAMKLFVNRAGGVTDDKLDSLLTRIGADDAANDQWKPGNAATKFIFGGEDDEVARPHQETYRDVETWGKEKGLGAAASPLAFAAATGAAALDNPIGGGFKAAGKGVYKATDQTVKELIKNGTVEDVARTLSTKASGLGEDVIARISPMIANLTDDKAIREVVDNAATTTARTAPTPVTTADDITPSLATPPSAAVDDTTEGAAQRFRNRMKTTEEITDDRASKPNFLERVREQLFDPGASLRQFGKAYKEKTGTALATEDDPRALFQLTNGANDAVIQRTEGLVESFTSLRNTKGVTGKTLLDDVKTLGIARQVSRDRAGVYGDDILKEATEAEEDLRRRLPPEAFAQVEGVIDDVIKFQDEQLVRLRDSGHISAEAYEGIKEVNPNYFSRFNLIEYIDENKALFGSANSRNVRNSIVKAVKGLDDESRFQILDPIEATLKGAFATERAVQNNGIFQSIRNLRDTLPEMVVQIRDADDVAKRIALSVENKEMRPIVNKMDRFMKTRARDVRRLQTGINNLEKKGMNLSLKNGGERMTDDNFLVTGMGGDVPTSQVGKAKDFVVNPSKLGPRDTSTFLRNLIENGSRSEIDRLKKMVGNRDAKMANFLDELGATKSEYDDMVAQIRANADEAKTMADKNIPEGFKTIIGRTNGIEERIAVPARIADAYTGKNDVQRGQMDKIFNAVGTPFKQALTSLSLPFVVVANPIRDARTAAYVSKYIPKKDHTLVLPYMKRWAEGLWIAMGQGGEAGAALRKEVVQAGGGNAGIYSDTRTADEMVKGITRKVNGPTVTNAADFMKEALRMVSAPVREGVNIAQRVGRAVDYAPRYAEAKAAKEAGESSAGVALSARNATADLQQGGSTSRFLNNYFTFLNSNLQGNYNVAKRIKEDPARAAVAAAATTLTPAIMGYAWNQTQYPDVLETISPEDRENNYVVILGRETDADGNPTQVIKIPKSAPDKLFGNVAENMMKALYDENPDSFKKMAYDALGTVSSINVAKDGEFNLSRAFGSTIGSNPIIGVPASQAANKNFYFDSPIVPENMQDLPNDMQVRDNTPGIDKFVAGVTGASPLKVQAARQGVSGNLLSDNPVDQAAGKLSGASGRRPTNEFYKVINKVAPNKASAERYINEAVARGDYQTAYATAQSYNSYLQEQFMPYAERYGEYMTPELIETYEKQKINLTPRGVKQRSRRAAAE